jgi:hypothetical protein
MNPDDYEPEEYASAVDGRRGSDRMTLNLPIIPDKDRGDMDEVRRLRTAIQGAIDHANGRESEWGERAQGAFEYLHNALKPPSQRP